MTNQQDLKLRDAVDQLLDEAEALGDLEGAMPLYERALTLDPNRASTHYNIGLVYKYRGAWAESLHHNRRASDLRADDEATNWNMGIAATALRDWAAAREAWRRVGIQIAEGEGPIEEDFGITPVRLNPDDGGEVVWGRRIDPVRVVLENIPYPASGFRAGDVVLHDGAPVGERQHNGRSYSVFNVLELFESSANSTYEAGGARCCMLTASEPQGVRGMTTPTLLGELPVPRRPPSEPLHRSALWRLSSKRLQRFVVASRPEEPAALLMDTIAQRAVAPLASTTRGLRAPGPRPVFGTGFDQERFRLSLWNTSTSKRVLDPRGTREESGPASRLV